MKIELYACYGLLYLAALFWFPVDPHMHQVCSCNDIDAMTAPFATIDDSGGSRVATIARPGAKPRV